MSCGTSQSPRSSRTTTPCIEVASLGEREKQVVVATPLPPPSEGAVRQYSVRVYLYMIFILGSPSYTRCSRLRGSSSNPNRRAGAGPQAGRGARGSPRAQARRLPRERRCILRAKLRRRGRCWTCPESNAETDLSQDLFSSFSDFFSYYFS